MNLPLVDRAEISETKIVKYLLSTTHRAGQEQGFFFMQFGFDSSRWEELTRALKQHAKDNDITLEVRTIFGTRYVIDGLLTAGRWKTVKCAYGLFIDDDGEVPRFITAHPLRRRRP